MSNHNSKEQYQSHIDGMGKEVKILPGQTVKIRNKDGSIENGWQVMNIEGEKVCLNKIKTSKTGAYMIKNKWVPLNELIEINKNEKK